MQGHGGKGEDAGRIGCLRRRTPINGALIFGARVGCSVDSSSPTPS
jgi:hypothetical protein